MVENQVNLEAPSSSKEIEGTNSDIQKKYKQIKEKNEEIKNEVYSQFLKEKPGNKDRFLTAFDYSTNKMIMSFLKTTVADPKSVSDYTKIDVEVDADTMHELEQIEFHRSTTEMIYSEVVTKTMSTIMLQKNCV